MLPKLSVYRPYTVMVAVVIIIILGAVSLMNMTTDLLPSINLPFSVIVTPYPGATPEEVEARVSRPIEQTMLTVSNVRSVDSISRNNLSLVILRFGETTNMDSAILEMRENLDLVSASMPSQVGSSMIMRINPDMMPIAVISAAVEGQSLAESSNFISTVIIPELERIPGVASATPSGLIEREIHVTLSEAMVAAQTEDLMDLMDSFMALPSFLRPAGFDMEAMLQNAGLDLDQLTDLELTAEMVAGILQGQNFSMPAGQLIDGDTSYLVRAGDRIRTLDELNSLPMLALPFPGVDPIVLADVADIVVTDNSENQYTRVNGNEAVTLTVQKQTDYPTAEVARQVRERSAEVMEQYPGLEIVSLMDQGIYVDMIVNNLISNILIGGLLALLVLLLFLGDLRPTMVVGVAIPVSLVTAFVMMYFSNVTLNIISMSGLALGVGMLVDNSIVVIENIYRMRSEGKDSFIAAVDGAKQVSGAITASTLTTIAVFLPIVFTEGLTRQIFTDMGLTITFSLLASLVIALTVVPTLAARFAKKSKAKPERAGISRLKARYAQVLNVALDRKAIVVVVILALFGGSLFGALNMGTEFFPTADTGQLMVEATMPSGYTFDEATAAADQLVAIVSEIDSVQTVGAMLGGQVLGMGFGFGGQNAQTLSMFILLEERRQVTTSEVAQQIRERTKDMEAIITVDDSNMDMTALSGGAISISVKGRELDTLQELAHDVAAIVASVEGTIEVSDGLEDVTPELRVIVDKEKGIARGLTVAQVFMELSSRLRPAQAATRLTIGPNSYEVYVYDNSGAAVFDRESLANLQISSPLGGLVKVNEIASIGDATALSSISRRDQERYVSVTAGIADGYNIGIISRQISDLLADYELPPGYSIEYGGEQQLILESFGDLYLMLLLGVVLIYLVMVAQFQSLLSPFIVMFTLPLAFTGGFISLMLTRNPLSIVAFLGLIVLAGVVVNNGIVFVDYINILRAEGKAKRQAIIEAGQTRLRPIIMTAITTVIALSVMTIGVGMGTEMVQPMAIAATGGLIYATLLTLIFIPVMYDLLNRERQS